MPTGVYDSSLLTQRARAKAESNSFINRIQNPTNPRTSYGPLTGIYDNSEVNRVSNGQMNYYQRNGSCTVAYIGCPCNGTTTPNNVIIVAPGPVTNVSASYGSVIVTWTPPTTGTDPKYILLADDQTTPANSVSISDITTIPYVFPTYIGPELNQLTPGDRYIFKVAAVNSAGIGTVGVSSDFYAPYVAPETSNSSSNADPNTVFIQVIPSYSAFTPNTPNKYILKTYTNNILTSTSNPTNYTGQDISVSGLSCLNVYTFQLQLLNNITNQYSSFGVKDDNLPVYPDGPNITGVSNITSTTAQVNYTNYTTGGFDLTTGGATCDVNGPSPDNYSYSNLTNTSVIITNLQPYTTYTRGGISIQLTITFIKTINDFEIDSAFSIPPTFTTNGIAPSLISFYGQTPTTASIIFGNYSLTSGTPGQFNFDDATVVVPGVTPSIDPITTTNTVNIGNLSAAHTYSNCTITLTGSGGAISDTSAYFTIVTPSDGITDLSQSDSTQTTINLTFTKPGTLPGTIQSVKVYYSAAEFGDVALINQGELQIRGLTSDSSYSSVYITVSDGTYTSMPSNTLASISTQPPPPPAPDAPTNVQLGTAGYYTQPITFNSYMTSLTGALISGGSYTYTNLTQSGLTITGLTPGGSYSGLTVQVQNAGGTSNSSNIDPFNTLSLPAPDETSYVGDYDINTNTTTISVFFNTYPSEFTPSSGTLYESSGNSLGSFYSVSSTSLVVTGLTPGNYYTNCYITLYNGTDTTPTSNRFDVATTPILGAAQQSPPSSSNQIVITYGDVGTSFGFNVGSAKIYANGQSWDQSAYAGNSSSEFATSLSGPATYSNCYIVLYNNSAQPSLPSNTFNIEIQ